MEEINRLLYFLLIKKPVKGKLWITDRALFCREFLMGFNALNYAQTDTGQN